MVLKKGLLEGWAFVRVVTFKDWSLSGYYPFVPYHYKDNYEFLTVVGHIRATVPGSVYSDLIAAGLIGDPYRASNSLACEWVANRWWVYKTAFLSSDFAEDTKKVLCFNGINNVASVVLNGQTLLRTEGANNPFEIDISRCLKQNNVLTVVIESEPAEYCQFGRTSEINTQRARFGYKWDFCLRLVDMGIYGDVFIKEYADAAIKDCRIVSELHGDDADMCVRFRADAVKEFAGEVCVTVEDASGKAAQGTFPFAVKNGAEAECLLPVSGIKRWYPNGSGSPHLYNVSVMLRNGGEVCDEYRTVYGFRTVETERNDNAPESSKKFLFRVNGKRIYIKGCNFVPFELYAGSHAAGDLKKFILLIQNMGCNMLRVWGGGYIESDEFYRLCSEHGILVWQDFIQSSSGLDSVANRSPEFLKKLAAVSEKAIKRLRNYPCLAVWNGGNELREPSNLYPIGDDNENARTLAALTRKLDGGRIFYPSSPYGGNFNFTAASGTNQNVHGHYKYYLGEYGIRHHEYYNASDSLFHAEFGVDGAACLSTIRKILPESDNADCSPADLCGSLNWKHLAFWWNTLERDEYFFGKLENLEDFVYASQYIQAEGVRYIADCNRRRAFANSGSMIWQADEPNPNASCTTIIDYYLNPKQAYFALKKSFQAVAGFVKYAKLDFGRGEKIALDFYFVNDTNEKRPLTIKITADETETVFEKTFAPSSVCGAAEKIYSLELQNVYEYGLRIDMTSGEYSNSVLVLSRGSRGHCDLGYVRRQALWDDGLKTLYGNR